VEQEVACSSGNLPGHYEEVKRLISSPSLTDSDKYGPWSRLLPPFKFSFFVFTHPACCISILHRLSEYPARLLKNCFFGLLGYVAKGGTLETQDSCPVSMVSKVSLLSHFPVILCRVRLVMLFALRYERDGRVQLADLLQRLQDFGLPRGQLVLVRTLLSQAGSDRRVGDLFSDRTLGSRLTTMAKQSLRV
jgi:hypothetical protein